ncbi:hypothetical protein IL992_38560 [Microbispora sp. NEAU-D428]|uniref:hypothetical protein n=1 Tax=Microbispora sitophila TaxID=2771537 RepID=UPI00186736F3|nr:hypothetical protein [Microbispora sitophila]MBE3015029.1 hypothetical protein [Microbispora sitophila]
MSVPGLRVGALAEPPLDRALTGPYFDRDPVGGDSNASTGLLVAALVMNELVS